MVQSGSGELRTIVQAVDLGDKSDYVPKIDALIAQVCYRVVVQFGICTTEALWCALQLEAGSYDRLFLVHNAGSLGELGFTNEWSSQEILSQYWEFNLTSVCWLNKRFLDAFGASRDELLAADAAAPVESPTPARSVIVNITSLCGIKPFETYSLYCTGKAAREMHHQVIAAEQAASDKVRVLSYSPGPMDTGMQQVFRESPMVHPKLAKNYITMKAEGTLVPPEKSSRRGVLLTLSGAFETGAHVDYYELEHLG